jgi:hypothetical protein
MFPVDIYDPQLNEAENQQQSGDDKGKATA